MCRAVQRRSSHRFAARDGDLPRGGWAARASLKGDPQRVENDPHALLGGHPDRPARREELLIPLAEPEVRAVQHLESVIRILHPVALRLSECGLLAV